MNPSLNKYWHFSLTYGCVGNYICSIAKRSLEMCIAESRVVRDFCGLSSTLQLNEICLTSEHGKTLSLFIFILNFYLFIYKSF